MCQCSGWKILVRHARYFTLCTFITWFFVYSTSTSTQLYPTNKSKHRRIHNVTSSWNNDRLSSRAPYCEFAYYSCSNSVTLIRKDHLFVLRLSLLILFDQTTIWEDMRIASAHGARQLESRPSGINDIPCWCGSQAMALITCPRRTFQAPLSLPYLKDSYPFVVELH